MSTIPPNWLGSIIQTQGSHARAAGDKQTEAATQAGRTDTFADKLQDVIEASDRDSQVYSDAEGSGSQGRPDEGPPAEGAAPDTPEPPDEPAGGLDLQA